MAAEFFESNEVSEENRLLRNRREAAGPREFPFRPATMFAPMEGVTHAALRALYAEGGGIGVVCTEFVRITSHPPSPRHLAAQVEKAPGVPLSVQVMGSDLLRMAEAADLVAAAGADVVDVNLGCPAPRVVRHGAGAALLRDVDRLYEILSAMRARIPGRFSAKIRAGFDTKDDALRIARAVEAAGVDYLVVHPRRRADFYAGVADWRIVRSIKAAVACPVVGNGDVWYAADARRMRDETGCDAVMIGRPALRNPWIFQQIAALDAGRAPPRPSGADVVAFVEELVRRLAARFEREPIGKVKELLGYLGRVIPDDRAFLRAVLREPTLDGVRARVAATFGPLSAEALDLAARPTFGLETSGSTEEPGGAPRPAPAGVGSTAR